MTGTDEQLTRVDPASTGEQWLAPRHLRPQRIYGLPELRAYQDRLNSTEILLDQQAADGHADRPAIHYRDHTMTYGGLVEQVNRVGNALRRLGVGEGDRVVIRSLNEPPALVANFATLKLGGVSVPTSPLLDSEQLAHIGTDCEPVVLLVNSFLLAAAVTARQSIPSLKHIVTFDTDPAVARENGCLALEELVAAEEPELAPTRRPRDAVAVLLYSSGLRERAMATAHLQEELLIVPDVYGRRGWRVRPDDVIAGAGPICFAGGYSTICTIPYRFGAAAAVLPLGTPPEDLFGLIKRYGITLLAALPTWYDRMLASPEADPADLHTLRMVSCGGEPLAPRTLAGWRERFGLEIYEGFGTNGMMHVCVSNVATPAVRPGSFGRPLPGYQAQVLTTEGRQAQPGEIGNLFVRGPVGTIYWGHPAAAAEVADRQRAAVRDGWVRIGDWVTRDDDDYLRFVAREEDLLSRGGDHFGPGEIESVVAEHPAVAEVGVFGQPGDTGEMAIIALIVPHQGAGETGGLTAELTAHLAARLPSSRLPDELLVVAALPRTRFGTLRRRAEWATFLREAAHQTPAAHAAS